MGRRSRRRGQRERTKKHDYPYTFTHVVKPKDRKGHVCRIVAKGAVPEVCMVEFRSDGATFIVARAALERVR